MSNNSDAGTNPKPAAQAAQARQTPAKPRALIITQTLPASTGLGAAMRLGCWVQALTNSHSVSLLVVSMDPDVTAAALAPVWPGMVADCLVLNAHQAAQGVPPPGIIDDIFSPQSRLTKRWPLSFLNTNLTRYQGQQFDAVLVVRLRLMPIWHLLQQQLQVQTRATLLDLDDIESRAQVRQVRTLGQRHYGRLGYWLALLEARKLARAEVQASQTMQRMAVCSAQDLALLAQRIPPARLCVVPNALALPAQLPANFASTPSAPLQLLFVGALDYQPNADAARWLLDSIWPLIQQALAPRPVQLTLVGRNPPAWLQQAAAAGGFSLHANVPDMRPYYLQAHATLVPLRAGGGTRIKILEAFAYGRPVISTTVGAEGLGLAHGRELLLADTPQSFAQQCAQLAGVPDSAAQLVSTARAKVEAEFSLAAFQRHVSAALG